MVCYSGKILLIYISICKIKYLFNIGHDTKIMQNMYKPKVKRSSIEIVMGKFIIIIFGI